MPRWLDELRWTAAVVVAADVVVIAVACLIALVVGSFERTTVGILVLGGAGLILLMALGSVSAGNPGGLSGGTGFGSGGMHYLHSATAEMLATQITSSDAVRHDFRRRTISGLGLALIGASLLVAGFAIVG